MASFGFFALVLVLIYWMNRAVVLFDQLIADGQSASVFFSFTALTLPKVIASVVPIASFAAAVYVTNRMSNESELTIVQATGFSSFRIARPVIYFGLLIAAFVAVLVHFILPIAERSLDEREAEIAENLTARLLVEGTFVHPSNRLTFYISDITPEGELLNLFLSDATSPETEITYTAQTAYLVKSDTGPQLVMVDGLVQTLNTQTNTLSVTRFNDFVLDVGGLMSINTSNRVNYRGLSTLELLRASDATQTATKNSVGTLRQTAHDRINQPLLSIVTALVGFSTLLIGGFSRFGVWRQVVLAILLIMGLQMIESATVSTARENPALWPILYLPTVCGFVLSWAMLYKSDHPNLFRMRRTPSEVAS